MPYTMEDFRRDVLKQNLEEMSPEALFKILPTEKLLKAMPPEERLKGLPTAVIENYLKRKKKGSRSRKPKRNE